MSPPTTNISQAESVTNTDTSSQAESSSDTQGEWFDDDDDMEYEPTTEGEEDIEFFEEDMDEGGDVYVDAEEDLGGVDIEFAMDEAANSAGDEDEGERTETEATATIPGIARRVLPITPTQIRQLLGQYGLDRIYVQHAGAARGIPADADGGGLLGGFGGLGALRRRRPKPGSGNSYPKVPSEVGQKLMDSGEFGVNDGYKRNPKRRSTKLFRKLLSRELGLESGGRERTANRRLVQGMIPSSTADTIIHYDTKCYSGQFSDDGNFFFSCAQDFKVRMYDTSNPYSWKYYKTVNYPLGVWTITDATLSPDNKYLAYSSIRHIVCLAPTDPGEDSEPWMLDFQHGGSRHGRGGGWGRFGIWSIRFSGDGREIVAGTGDDSVYVYDIERRQTILRIPGHKEDVNAVCFGDKMSPHILYSGSDDTTLKVWDRRSMGDGREAGVFLGHTEGLTYVDSKGDGRYVLSNGKDQTMKLWDLRKMMSTDRYDKVDTSRYSTQFDYRMDAFDEGDYQPHPHDCSLVTFRGHKVLKTLIRCHFSPPGSTNSRYVYSGSADGSVWIYNLDATVAGKVNVFKATKDSRPKKSGLYNDTYEFTGSGSRHAWSTCVRDASWHPSAPIIAATSWNGWGMGTGTCTMHSWNDGAEDDEGEPRMGARVDQKLAYDEDVYGSPGNSGSGRSQFARSRLRTRRAAVANGDDSD
ncbi:MAG: hypothetical protein M1836_007856 [Candelina mexicana]|nr:MAG: hypothetical protein M1836_007856 [Candelina mexicana]